MPSAHLCAWAAARKVGCVQWGVVGGAMVGRCAGLVGMMRVCGTPGLQQDGFSAPQLSLVSTSLLPPCSDRPGRLHAAVLRGSLEPDRGGAPAGAAALPLQPAKPGGTHCGARGSGAGGLVLAVWVPVGLTAAACTARSSRSHELGRAAQQALPGRAYQLSCKCMHRALLNALPHVPVAAGLGRPD